MILCLNPASALSLSNNVASSAVSFGAGPIGGAVGTPVGASSSSDGAAGISEELASDDPDDDADANVAAALALLSPLAFGLLDGAPVIPARSPLSMLTRAASSLEDGADIVRDGLSLDC